jgi:hypothetical protein
VPAPAAITLLVSRGERWYSALPHSSSSRFKSVSCCPLCTHPDAERTCRSTWAEADHYGGDDRSATAPGAQSGGCTRRASADPDAAAALAATGTFATPLLLAILDAGVRRDADNRHNPEAVLAALVAHLVATRPGRKLVAISLPFEAGSYTGPAFFTRQNHYRARPSLLSV